MSSAVLMFGTAAGTVHDSWCHTSSRGFDAAILWPNDLHQRTFHEAYRYSVIILPTCVIRRSEITTFRPVSYYYHHHHQHHHHYHHRHHTTTTTRLLLLLLLLLLTTTNYYYYYYFYYYYVLPQPLPPPLPLPLPLPLLPLLLLLLLLLLLATTTNGAKTNCAAPRCPVAIMSS